MILAEVDPRHATWLTGTIAYTLATVACAGAGIRAGKARGWWWAMAALAAALTIDLQTNYRFYLSGLLSGIARDGHWYDGRRPIQAAFLAAGGLAGIMLTAWLLWGVRRHGWPLRLGLFGTALGAALFLLDVVSLHQVDEILNATVGRIMAIGIGWVVAATFLTAGAWGAARQNRRRY